MDEKIVGLSISQWLPCPLAIRNLLFGMTILLNLVKCYIYLCYKILFSCDMQLSLSPAVDSEVKTHQT